MSPLLTIINNQSGDDDQCQTATNPYRAHRTHELCQWQVKSCG